MRIANIKSALIDKLEEITDILEVKGYLGDVDGFPSATVLYRGSDSEEYTNSSFKETHKFEIDIDYAYDSSADSESIMIDLCEKVIDKLDANRNLNGTCEYCRITGIEEIGDDEAQKVRQIMFNLECIKRK